MPLLPEEDYDLHLSGDVDAERFVSIFRGTWPRLPAGARHCLISRWWHAMQRPRPPDVPACPFFVLTDGLVSPQLGDVAGLFIDRWHFFAWHAPTMDFLPDALVAAAVAHELGHAIVAEVSPGDVAREHIIDQLVERWGFAMDQLRAMTVKARQSA